MTFRRTAMMFTAIGLVTATVAFEANALMPTQSPPSLEGDIMQARYICQNVFVYAPRRWGRCPSGYRPLSGIAGNRCAKTVRKCGWLPSCGTGVC